MTIYIYFSLLTLQHLFKNETKSLNFKTNNVLNKINYASNIFSTTMRWEDYVISLFEHTNSNKKPIISYYNIFKFPFNKYKITLMIEKGEYITR